MDDRQEYREDQDTTLTILGFRHTDDMEAFLDRHSDTKYDTVYHSRNELSPQYADTLMTLPIGEVYGPYRDGIYFKVSRKMAVQRVPSAG